MISSHTGNDHSVLLQSQNCQLDLRRGNLGSRGVGLIISFIITVQAKPRSLYFNWLANIFESNISKEIIFSKFRNKGRKKGTVTFQNILILSIRRLENYDLFSISELDTLLKLRFSSVKMCPEAMAQRARLTNWNGINGCFSLLGLP